MPADICQAALVCGPFKVVATLQGGVPLSQCDCLLKEIEEVTVFLHEGPVEPGDGVILTVRVVIALLRSAHFVASDEHRHALGEQKQRREVANLLLAEAVDVWIVALPLPAAVPAQVVIDPVTVSLTIRFVVLTVVGHQVVEGEAVMGGDKIDAIDGEAPIPLIEIGTAANPRSDSPCKAPVTSHEAADVVAIATVPF